MNNRQEIIIENHPWEPFIPDNAKVFILGTFPPKPNRWSMDFYYPNPINDFWRIIGLVFNNDKDSLLIREFKTFDLDRIKSLLTDKGIAIGDTGLQIKRLRGNASDKYLEIISPLPLRDLIDKMPDCNTIATTGEKAAEVIAELTGTKVPRIGIPEHTVCYGRNLKIYRMPSSSRAYPLPLHQKAEHYRSLFRDLGMLPTD